MVQGSIKTGLYETYSKRKGDAKGLRDRKNFNDVREWFRIKWKLVIAAAVLLTSIFIFTGVIIYINLQTSFCQKGKINVHIIPYVHSNLDPYLTPDEFIENDLRHTFDFLVDGLRSNKRRKFTIVETYPFWRWWKTKSQDIRKSVRDLIKEGRLEIAGGGWCVPDEAVTDYRSFLDQYTLGLRYVQKIAGRSVSPDVTFLVDNHGHSREFATFMKEMGVTAMLLGGVSAHEQFYRKTFKRMEFLWSSNEGLNFGNEKPNIFTSVLDDEALKLGKYFAFENPNIDIDEFYKSILCQSISYNTNNIFIPVGAHFRFKNTKNMFKVIDYIIRLADNPKYKMNVIYSTPSYYLNSFECSGGRWWKSFAEFLPYATNKFDFWTGYYSSRPSLKYFQRQMGEYLQVFKQLAAFRDPGAVTYAEMDLMKETVALSHHHEGVSGVASHDTANYFAESLYDAYRNSTDVVDRLLRNIIDESDQYPESAVETCLLLNISECKPTEENANFIVTVYNPSDQSVNQYVRIPVRGNRYLVRAGNGESLRTQIVNIPPPILHLPGRESRATKELVFRVKDVPPLGYKSLYVSLEDAPSMTPQFVPKKDIDVAVNKHTAKIAGIIRNGELYPVCQELMAYVSWLSRNSVFRPEGRPGPIAEGVNLTLLNDGQLVTEHVQVFSSWASQIIRVYDEEDFVELKWIVGPIPLSFIEGKEIVSAFSTTIKNGNVFYTDIHGRRLAHRERNDDLNSEKVGAFLARNYQPVTSHIAIDDFDYQLHVFNDRAQGGTSAFEGEVELMIHRRLLNANVLARSEDLNERAYNRGVISTGTHWLFVGSAKDLRLKESIETFAAKSHWEPWLFFANASDMTYDDWRLGHVTEFSAIKVELPRALRILSLEPWSKGQILLRLENLGNEGSDIIQVDLEELFTELNVLNATYVSHAGTHLKERSKKALPPKFAYNRAVKLDDSNRLDNLVISVYPTEIKTLILTVKRIR